MGGMRAEGAEAGADGQYESGERVSLEDRRGSGLL